jgi:hypothetical protein
VGESTRLSHRIRRDLEHRYIKYTRIMREDSVKYAHITPIPLLDRVLGGMVGADFHLVVSSEILESAEYLDFYRGRLRQGEFVILDSPAFETQMQTDLQDTLHAVHLLHPSEVVLPDDMNSASNTLTGSSKAVDALSESGYTGRFMAVPHGETLETFTKCAEDLLQLDNADRITLGLQEEIPELFGISRQEMVEHLNGITGEILTFHLLGVDEALEDQYTTGVRSCDTAKFVVWGLNGRIVEPGSPTVPAYPGRKTVGGRTGYFHYNTDDLIAIECAKMNVWKWR